VTADISAAAITQPALITEGLQQVPTGKSPETFQVHKYGYTIVLQDGTFAPRDVEGSGLRNFGSRAEAEAAAKQRCDQFTALKRGESNRGGWYYTYKIFEM
jgi:hypothetical protein